MLSVSGRKYKQKEKLGDGMFSTVYAVTRDDGVDFAFKKFKTIKNNLSIEILREISILNIFKEQKSENGVIKPEDIIFDTNIQTFGIVMKKYSSDLFDAISDYNFLNERERIVIAKRILETVVFLHDNGVIHRDIKLENILLDDDKKPVLADYTMSKILYDVCQNDDTHSGEISTVSYRSPEVIANKSYGFPADAWSLGVTFYELFTSYPLQFTNDKDSIDFLLKEMQVCRDTPLWKMISGLLIVDPKKRWTARRALESNMFDTDYKSLKVCEFAKPCIISPKIRVICEEMEVDKKITYWAAQTYLNKTDCSIHSAVELACKFYETDIFSISNPEEYAEEEILILKKMGYNLFI